jgi:hypothetical protein
VSFWDEVRVLRAHPGPGAAPAHALGEKDPPDLRAAHHDVFGPCCCGQGIQRPLGRPGLVEGPQFPDGLPPQSPRWHGLDQGNDPGSFLLGDPSLAALPAQIIQPVQAQAVEAVQPAADRFWLQSSSTAIAGTRIPDQLSSIIRARITASLGAFRARDNLRTTARSCSSRSGRAHKTIAQHPPPSTLNYPATRTYTQPKRNPAVARMGHHQASGYTRRSPRYDRMAPGRPLTLPARVPVRSLMPVAAMDEVTSAAARGSRGAGRRRVAPRSAGRVRWRVVRGRAGEGRVRWGGYS